MGRRLETALRAIWWIHVVGGLVLLVAIALASPLVIGDGRIAQAINAVERLDFRWWLLALAAVAWMVPIVIGMLLRAARQMELDEALAKLLANRSFPIQVDIDTRIPVHFDTRVRVPVEVDTRIDLDEELDIEAQVPIKVRIPIDTEVETRVLRLGTIKIPIRTEVPVDMVLPLRTRVRVGARGLPIHLREEAIVQLPSIDVPLASRIETRLQFLGTVKSVLKALRSRKRAEERRDDSPEVLTG